MSYKPIQMTVPGYPDVLDQVMVVFREDLGGSMGGRSASASTST